MKHEEWEQRVRNVPVRKVPEHWKHEILNRAVEASRVPIAEEATRTAHVGAVERKGILARTLAACESLWWSWRGWSALGASWVAILMLHWILTPSRGLGEGGVAAAVPLTQEARLILAEQKRAMSGTDMDGDFRPKASKLGPGNPVHPGPQGRLERHKRDWNADIPCSSDKTNAASATA